MMDRACRDATSSMSAEQPPACASSTAKDARVPAQARAPDSTHTPAISLMTTVRFRTKLVTIELVRPDPLGSAGSRLDSLRRAIDDPVREPFS